jgi:N-acetylneuraminic acid mutarotase
MKKKSDSRSGFFNSRGMITLLVVGAAACSLLTGTLLPFLHADGPATISQRKLTFEERVAYQRAIEDVYWRHRIWPKERRDPKPSLDAGMSQAQLEKKVAEYLRNSQALEDYWQRPITAEQLQAEMDRMAQHTNQPEVLLEVFAALGNDPFVIAECLARPVLAEGLLRKIHDAYQEPLDSRRASSENQKRKPVAAVTGSYTLPIISTGPNGCVDDTWTATITTNAPDARAGHTAVWTGSEMIVWGGGASGPVYFNTGGRYNPSTDSWTATSTTNAPDARAGHMAVWTGSEMIVWGGYNGSDNLNTGGRYNPGTDSWTATSTTNAPGGRQECTAVWTGSEMIVWGGFKNGTYLNTGARYNPSMDSWTATSTANAPQGRYEHTAVWSGSEMIVWGGFFRGDPLNNGGKYNPGTDSWTATSTTGAPAGRGLPTSVWTSSEMIIWGGWDDSVFLNTGGRYKPDADTWTATSTTDAPTNRFQHTAVWTGSEMIVWGGWDPPNIFNTGGKYNPGTDSWTATSTANAPTARYVPTGVWTGSEMIVWGGGASGLVYLNTGGRYCAQFGPTPTPTSSPRVTPRPRPTPRTRPTPP